MREKVKQMQKKKAKNLEPKRGEEISRVSGDGKRAWTVGFDRVSVFGSAEDEEEEEERPRLRASSHRVGALVSSVGNDDSQLNRFLFRWMIFDQHSWLEFSVNRRSLAEC